MVVGSTNRKFRYRFLIGASFRFLDGERRRRSHAVRCATRQGQGREAVEDAALAQATVPRGLVLAAPMSFGLLHVAPLLPAFLAIYPEVSVDLHLSDAMVDIIGEGFDAAIRIAVLPDSSLVVRRLYEMPRYLVGSPTHLDKHGRPKHPLHLAQHRCISYSNTTDCCRIGLSHPALRIG